MLTLARMPLSALVLLAISVSACTPAPSDRRVFVPVIVDASLDGTSALHASDSDADVTHAFPFARAWRDDGGALHLSVFRERQSEHYEAVDLDLKRQDDGLLASAAVRWYWGSGHPEAEFIGRDCTVTVNCDPLAPGAIPCVIDYQLHGSMDAQPQTWTGKVVLDPVH